MICHKVGRILGLAVISSAFLAAAAPAAETYRHPGEQRGKTIAIPAVNEGAITVDGDVKEWGAPEAQDGIIDQTFDHLSGPPSDGADAAVIRLRRDSQALYVAIQVADRSVLNPREPGEFYMGDCIELYLDVRPAGSGKAGTLGSAAYSDGVYQLLLVPPVDGKPARLAQYNKDAKVGAFDLTGRTTPDGYALELRLPYSSLHGANAARLTAPIGFEVMVDDLDAAQQAGPPQQRVYSFGGRGGCFRDASAFACAGADSAHTLPAPYLRVMPANLVYRGDAPVIASGAICRFENGAKAPMLRLQNSCKSGPFETETLAAIKAKDPSEVPSAQSDSFVASEHPQLGIQVERHTWQTRDMAPGRHTFTTSFDGAPQLQTSTRFYGLWQDEKVQLRQLAPDPWPTMAQLVSGIYPSLQLDSYFVERGQPLAGSWRAYVPGEIWWGVSEWAERYSRQASPGTAVPPPPFYYFQVEAINVANNQRIWDGRLPLKPGLLKLKVPSDKWPVGDFLLNVRAVLRGDVMVDFQDDHRTAIPLHVIAPYPNTWVSSVKDAPRVFNRAIEIGSPNRERFPKDDTSDCQARSVWDLQAHENRIYIGCGDWDLNRGPIDIWSFAPVASDGTAQFKKEFTVDDESVDIMRSIGGTLYVPGTDARESWDLGNLYTKRDDKWTKLRTIPNGLHILDAAVFEKKLYVTTGTESGAGFFESTDGGLKWRRIVSDKKLEEHEGRYWQLAPIQGSLLVFPTRANRHLFQYQNGRLKEIAIPIFPGYDSRNMVIAHRVEPFLDGVVYTTFRYESDTERGPLFYLSNLKQGAVSIEQFKNEAVQDILVRDEMCYVLTGKVAAESFQGEIFSSTDLRTWTRRARFQVPSLPHSLEMLDGTFYVGLINRGHIFADIESGSIWKIAD